MDTHTTDETSWDSLCKQCGRCCFEKWENDRGKITYTDIACRYLDVATRSCKIYEQRFTINPSCVKLTPELVPALRWLPRDCGYRPPTTSAPPKSKKHTRKKK